MILALSSHDRIFTYYHSPRIHSSIRRWYRLRIIINLITLTRHTDNIGSLISAGLICPHSFASCGVLGIAMRSVEVGPHFPAISRLRFGRRHSPAFSLVPSFPCLAVPSFLDLLFCFLHWHHYINPPYGKEENPKNSHRE